VTSDALALDNSNRLLTFIGSNHPALLLPQANQASQVEEKEVKMKKAASLTGSSSSKGLLKFLDDLSVSMDEYDFEEQSDLFDDYPSEHVRVEAPATFVVVHYFGKVNYDALSFPTRQHLNVLATHPALEKSGINSSLTLLSLRNKQALNELSRLAQSIDRYALHFVKCLRAFPSIPRSYVTKTSSSSSTTLSSLSSGLSSGGGGGSSPGFDRRHVCETLRRSGLLEAASLLRQSRPIRWTHKEFSKKFTHLLECSARPQRCNEVMSEEVTAAWQLKEATPLVSYVVSFHSASMGFGLKFVRNGLPVVARRTPKAPACVLAGHVLRNVAGVDLYDVKKTTLANAEADGKVCDEFAKKYIYLHIYVVSEKQDAFAC
jgi:hypothetical protein